ncbi:MAG: hypothetical protein REI11_11825 [Patulibacter sp.]|nr:hypothetical protein [Patulibacter sp.]
MPTFCRHGRFEASCAICRMEKAKSEPAAATPSAKGTAARRPTSSRTASAGPAPRSRSVATGQLSRNADDGFRSDLLPGLRSTADVMVLAEELTKAEARLSALGGEDAGPWTAVSERVGDPAAAFVASLVVAVASPDEAAGSVATAATALTSLLAIDPTLTALEHVAGASEVQSILDAGPRGPRAHDAAGAALSVPAALAARSGGSLEVALAGEASWTPERRFARLLDRLALRGLPRAARFDLLVALGRTGALEVEADGLHLGGDQVTDAAKRLFAIADVPLLEKRAAAIVELTGVRWDAFELALWNIAGADATGTGAAARWSTAKPATTLGLPGDTDDEQALVIAELLQG